VSFQNDIFFQRDLSKNRPVLFNGLGQTDMAGGLPSQAQKWKMLPGPCTTTTAPQRRRSETVFF